jgi:hypothetical protein
METGVNALKRFVRQVFPCGKLYVVLLPFMSHLQTGGAGGLRLSRYTPR